MQRIYVLGCSRVHASTRQETGNPRNGTSTNYRGGLKNGPPKTKKRICAAVGPSSVRLRGAKKFNVATAHLRNQAGPGPSEFPI